MSEEPRNGNVDRWRLDKLEEYFSKLETRFDNSQEKVSQEIRSLRSAVQELHLQVRSGLGNTCPAPGKCLELERRLEGMVKQMADGRSLIQKILLEVFRWVPTFIALALVGFLALKGKW